MNRRDFLKLSALAVGAPVALATAKRACAEFGCALCAPNACRSPLSFEHICQTNYDVIDRRPIISTAKVEVLHRDRFVPIGGLAEVRPGDVFRMLYDGKVLDPNEKYTVCLALEAPKLIDINDGRARTYSVGCENMPSIAASLRSLPWDELGAEMVFLATGERRGTLKIYLYRPKNPVLAGTECGVIQARVMQTLRDTLSSIDWHVGHHAPGAVSIVATTGEDIPFCASAPVGAVRWPVFGVAWFLNQFAVAPVEEKIFRVGRPLSAEDEQKILELLAKSEDDPTAWVKWEYGIERYS